MIWPKMNPADLDSIRHAISQQGNMLGQHSTALQEIASSVQNLSASLTSIQAQLSIPAEIPPPVSPPTPAASGAVSFREPKSGVGTPDKYEGDLGKLRSFLMQYGLVFDLQPNSYTTDKARIAFVIELLRGRALEWASALWERQDTCMASYQEFTAEMRKLFDHPVGRHGLTKEERQRRRETNSCLYCGNPGHYISACPQRPLNSSFSLPITLSDPVFLLPS
uniref:CCHC-type domain-containing protein n=1 Tax=Sander lucioperca TaxID=283035 RepID=A0A8C9ZG27_SANLU